MNRRTSYGRAPLRPFHPTPVALAVLATCAALAGAPASAQAQTTAGTQVQYSIPPGPLDQTLNRFAAEAGILLTIDGRLTAGKTSPGLNSRSTVKGGLQQLLQGTGLQAVEGANGYQLRPIPPAAGGPVTLGEVHVSAAGLGNTTEGSGSYTTGSMRTSTRLSLSVRETPQSVSVVTRQQMDDQGLVQLTDVVQQTTGLSIAQGGNMGSDSSPIYSRGFIVENYQVDGIGFLNSNYSSIFQTSDTALFDRVEVVRGASGLMNGIGTPSASINMVRKRPTAVFQGRAKVEAGSWDFYRAEADLSGPINEAGTLRGRVVAVRQDNRSYIDRLKEERRILYGIVEADIAPNTLATLGFTWQSHDATGHSRGGLPLFNADGTRARWSRSDSAAAAWAYSERESFNAFASLEHHFANQWTAQGTLNYARTRYDEQMGYATGGAPDPATGAGVFMYAGRWGAPPTQYSLDVSANGPFQLLGREHELVVGATLSRMTQDAHSYRLWHTPAIDDIYNWDGKTPPRPDSSPIGQFDLEESTRSAFATARFRLSDPLSVIVGARITSWEDRRHTRNYTTLAEAVTTRKWSGEVTPYAGITYDLNDNWSLYGSYTDIFKPQSQMDPQGEYLDPLMGRAYEVGAKGEFYGGRLNFGLGMYRIQQDNLGVAIPGVTAPNGSQAYRAESGTETHGIELELGGQITPDWQATVGFARNLPRDKDGKLLNTQVPQNTVKLFSTYRVSDRFTVGGGVRWQNGTWSDLARGRVKQESYALVDLMARYVITDSISATLNVYNLTDRKYQTSSQSAYFGAPRSIRAGVDFAF